MDIYTQELEKIFHLELFNYLAIIVLTIIAIVICFILRKKKVYMVSLFLSFLCFLIMLFITVSSLTPLYNDITNHSFIKMENVSFSCPVNKFDFDGIQEISVQDNDNSKIILKTTKQFDDEFNGTIVYSKESKYIVFSQSNDT